ncbi:MAG: mannose-1-phosphate guanylyltransferase/mannose-6-phosphate isomerase [Actinobacteria bacterium HGW-Actinobacteria-1]|jgi:mannose-1-phosphate guanylyltransferase/mannose-6-phosphate isomerase|nr:MAG: mannose-1-phosphate guanylyltransferase/mannose-6-phosphate isomerase [Actinobacteria bacterium HGW-Actinobacteria-1]
MPTTQRIPHLHAVVLAGGSGTRFWPLSRELAPKQFVSIFGGVSLITQAVLRVSEMTVDNGIHVLTNEHLLDELRNHLKSQHGIENIGIDYLAEPTPRNTAAAIALAAAYLLRTDPDALMVVLPSDHLLEDGERWARTMRVAAGLAADGRLVTLGLTPTYPETGYGYIRMGTALPEHAEDSVIGHEVVAFVEKPDRQTAEVFLETGEYLWNSGMLVARADTVLRELDRAGHAGVTPESVDSATIAAAAREVASANPQTWTSDENRATFAALPSVPFDKAALEVSDRVAVVPADLEWSDVGSLLALQAVAEPDACGNTFSGNVVDVDSRDTIVYSADRLVATLGLKDTIVVDTADATLVASKDRAQDVRLIVDALRVLGAREIVESRSSLRPWGSWTMLVKGEGFQVKTIDVLPGHRLSLQSHSHRSEHWIVVEGCARVTIDDAVFDVSANESKYIPLGAVHRLENAGSDSLRIVEVAVGDYLGEDDIVRYEDDWAR